MPQATLLFCQAHCQSSGGALEEQGYVATLDSCPGLCCYVLSGSLFYAQGYSAVLPGSLPKLWQAISRPGLFLFYQAHCQN
jgi:hypothetical protein